MEITRIAYNKAYTKWRVLVLEASGILRTGPLLTGGPGLETAGHGRTLPPAPRGRPGGFKGHLGAGTQIDLQLQKPPFSVGCPGFLSIYVYISLSVSLCLCLSLALYIWALESEPTNMMVLVVNEWYSMYGFCNRKCSPGLGCILHIWALGGSGVGTSKTTSNHNIQDLRVVP